MSLFEMASLVLFWFAGLMHHLKLQKKEEEWKHDKKKFIKIKKNNSMY